MALSSPEPTGPNIIELQRFVSERARSHFQASLDAAVEASIESLLIQAELAKRQRDALLDQARAKMRTLAEERVRALDSEARPDRGSETWPPGVFGLHVATPILGLLLALVALVQSPVLSLSILLLASGVAVLLERRPGQPLMLPDIDPRWRTATAIVLLGFSLESALVALSRY